MGFFLHIPFPSWDIIRIFPWCDEILQVRKREGTGSNILLCCLFQGMLGCDMVGFHIEDYCINFLDCCQRCLGCRVDRNKMLVEHCGRFFVSFLFQKFIKIISYRTVQVKMLPIGIPYDRLFISQLHVHINKSFFVDLHPSQKMPPECTVASAKLFSGLIVLTTRKDLFLD